MAGRRMAGRRMAGRRMAGRLSRWRSAPARVYAHLLCLLMVSIYGMVWNRSVRLDIYLWVQYIWCSGTLRRCGAEDRRLSLGLCEHCEEGTRAQVAQQLEEGSSGKDDLLPRRIVLREDVSELGEEA